MNDKTHHDIHGADTGRISHSGLPDHLTVVDETSDWGEEEWSTVLNRMISSLPEQMPDQLVMHPYAFFLGTEILPLQMLQAHYRRAGNRRMSGKITREIHRAFREWRLDFAVDAPGIDRLMLARIRYKNPRGVGLIRALRTGHKIYG